MTAGAPASLRRLASLLRRSPDDADGVARATSGAWQEGTPGSALEPALVAALHADGLLERDEDRWRLTVRIVNAGGLLTVLPAPDTADAARVYLRPDSLWLLRLIWERDLTGSAAADLGCGSGFLAAALAARYRRVLATELEPVCLTYAGWTLALNRTAARSTGVLATDAGAGLRSGAFDLVAANPPWMPMARAEHHVPGERPQVWAYGGHRGWEIPRRFLDDAVRMLAPGGTAIVLGLATVWADGEAPLADRVASLRAAGFEVEVVASKGLYSVAAAERLCAAVDGLVSARHVATIVRRPVPVPAPPEMSRRANVA